MSYQLLFLYSIPITDEHAGLLPDVRPLPGGELDLALVLAARAGLRDETRPGLRVAGELEARSRMLFEDADAVLRHHRADGPDDLGDDVGLARVLEDSERPDAL